MDTTITVDIIIMQVARQTAGDRTMAAREAALMIRGPVR